MDTVLTAFMVKHKGKHLWKHLFLH